MNKCYFMQDAVEYLGHRVDAEGLRATPEKVAVIENTPLPQNAQQMRSFLGLLNYYRKFLISHVLHNGVEGPVAFALCSLSKSEQNYS